MTLAERDNFDINDLSDSDAERSVNRDQQQRSELSEFKTTDIA